MGFATTRQEMCWMTDHARQTPFTSTHMMARAGSHPRTLVQPGTSTMQKVIALRNQIRLPSFPMNPESARRAERTSAARISNTMEARQLASGTINLRLGAVRRLAYEAADSGLLSSDLAAGICRGKRLQKHGV